jgi:hypothetical protein
LFQKYHFSKGQNFAVTYVRTSKRKHDNNRNKTEEKKKRKQKKATYSRMGKTIPCDYTFGFQLTDENTLGEVRDGQDQTGTLHTGGRR